MIFLQPRYLALDKLALHPGFKLTPVHNCAYNAIWMALNGIRPKLLRTLRNMVFLLLTLISSRKASPGERREYEEK